MACVANGVGTVSEKLMHKMSVQAPPKITIEKYMIEIAKYYNVEYEPDPQVKTLEPLLHYFRYLTITGFPRYSRGYFPEKFESANTKSAYNEGRLVFGLCFSF